MSRKIILARTAASLAMFSVDVFLHWVSGIDLFVRGPDQALMWGSAIGAASIVQAIPVWPKRRATAEPAEESK